jgi:glycosyltransferase involved in cell wall biosynthesis
MVLVIENLPEINEEGPPAVSVLVASYNSAVTIERTLRSLAAQKFTDFQCLVSDDNSSDNTLALADAFSSRDSRFRILPNQENLGWIGNVNRLLAMVDTEFFMIMPHDDVLAPRYLEALVEGLNQNPEAIVSFSDMEYFYLDGRREILSYELDVRNGLEKKRSIRMLRSRGHWWIPYRGLVRTGYCGSGIRLRRNLAGEAIADFPWVLDLAMRGEFVRVPEILYTKYVYYNSLSHNWAYNTRQHVAVLLSCMGASLTGPLSVWNKSQLILLLTRRIQI